MNNGLISLLAEATSFEKKDQSKVRLVFSDAWVIGKGKLVIRFLARLDSTACCGDTSHTRKNKRVEIQEKLWRQNLKFYVSNPTGRVISVLGDGLVALSFYQQIKSPHISLISFQRPLLLFNFWSCDWIWRSTWVHGVYSPGFDTLYGARSHVDGTILTLIRLDAIMLIFYIVYEVKMSLK